jgi:hypothetical protein
MALVALVLLVILGKGKSAICLHTRSWLLPPPNGLELSGPAKSRLDYRAELAGSAPARGCAKTPKTRIAFPLEARIARLRHALAPLPG